MCPRCHLLVFTNWRAEPHFRQVIEAAGYEIRASLVWDKSRPNPGDFTGFAPSHERIIHASRGHAPVEPRPNDVLRYDRVNVKVSNHPAQKPLDLLSRLIEVTTKPTDLVCDPFAGSGSTLEAALTMGRRAFGIEFQHEHYIGALKRLHDRNTTAPVHEQPAWHIMDGAAPQPLALAG